MRMSLRMFQKRGVSRESLIFTMCLTLTLTKIQSYLENGTSISTIGLEVL